MGPVLIVALAGARTAEAIPAAVATSDLAVTRWVDAPGLPLPDVSRLTLDGQGFLWIGTKSGLARFDGQRFRSYEVPALTPDAHRRVHEVFLDTDGALWVATQGTPGLVALAKGTWAGPAHGAVVGIVRRMAHDRSGRVWLASNRGLFLLEDGRARLVADTRALGGDAEALLPARSGAVWVGSKGGLWSVDDGLALAPVPGIPGHILSLADDGDGGLWIGGAAGLWQLRQGTARRVSPADGLPATRVYALRRDRDGGLWVGTRVGLFRLRADKFEAVAARPGGITAVVWDVLEDGHGDLWAGSQAGLFRVRAPRFARIELPREADSAPARIASTFLIDADGTAWVGTAAHGLGRHRAGLWRWWTTADGLCTDAVLALTRTRDGALWIGGEATGSASSCRFDGSRFHDVAGARPAGAVRSLFEDDEDRLWVGGAQLNLLVDDVLVPQALPDADPGPDLGISRITGTADGTLWIVGRRGTWRQVEGRWTPVRPRGGDEEKPWFFDVANDGKGAYWLAGDRGIARLEQDVLHPFTAARGFLDVPVYGLLPRDGVLWLATSHGAVSVREAHVRAYAQGRLDRIPYVRFGEHDGLPADTIARGGAPLATPDGRIWFVTARGLASIDPREGSVAPAPPPVVIETVRVNGEAAAIRDGGRVDAPRGRGVFEVAFTAPALDAAEDLRFQYRLDPVDLDWTTAGNERSARYQNLAAGDYQFLVRVSRGPDLDRSSQASLGLTLQPRFVDTAAFQALLALGLLGIALGLHRLRTWRLRGQHRAAIAERARIARELHDTLAQSVGAIAFRLEDARMHGDHLKGAARESVDSAWELARQTVREARDAIWRLRHEPLTDEDLPEALRNLGGRAGVPVPVQVKITGPRLALDGETTQALLRVAQEAILNAARHARPSRILVSLDHRPGLIEVRIEDDGAGLPDATPTPGHYGIAGMKERAQALGGTLQIARRPEGGTAVTMRLPRPRPA